MKDFFIHDGGEQEGPFSIAELKEKNISPNTHIWYEGLEHWKEASEIDELKELFKNSPPPFKSQAKQGNESKKTIELSILEQEAEKKNKTRRYIGIIAASILIVLLISFIVQKNTEASIETALNNKDYENFVKKQKSDSLEDIRLEEERIEIEKLEKEKIEKARLNSRNNFLNQISIKRSNYSADKFLGGITNLHFDVINSTDYKIDLIKIEVRYIRTNGGLFKTEIVNVTNIKPKNSIRVNAPDSYKGVTVKYDVLNIYSKNLSFCYKKDDFNNNSNDPYNCDG